MTRPRLLALLDEGSRGPLTLVSAPAGSGKTALLSSWVEAERAPGPVAWLSLSAGDGERRRFWALATAAMARAAAPLRPLAVPPRAQLDTFLPKLAGVLGNLRRPLTFVLDDFHEVEGNTVSKDLERLVEHAPDRLRLVIATRMDPPMRLERLRVAGLMAEIRAHDLAFTLEEAGSLELGLSTDDLETLWHRTEGWAAGLRLAALSLPDQPDPHAFVEGFAGDDRALSDYLIAEVISRQPPDTLDFLMRTSIADGLSGDLADALTGTTGGGRMLAELVHGDGLVDPLEGPGAWYRYHPLFADVLRMELARRLPDEVAGLHRRAALWHAGRGSPLEAVRHSVAARDWKLASELLGEHWLSLLLKGQAATLRELIRPIPDRVVRSRAEVALAAGGLLLEHGDGEGADELLELARERAALLPESRRKRLEVMSTSTNLYRARLRGDLEEAVRSAELVLQEHWEREVADDVRALTLANLGVAEFWADRMPVAARHLQEAAGLARECGNDYVLFVALGYAAAVDAQTGRVNEAWRRAREAIELGEARGWSATPQAAIGYLARAAVHVYRSELDRAAAMLERMRTCLHHSGEGLAHLAMAQLEARLLLGRGDPLTGLDVLRGATSAATHPIPPFLRVWGGVLEAELLLATGEAGAARRLLGELAAAEQAPDAAVGLARLDLAAGDPEAAIRAVATFLHDEQPAVQPYAGVEARLMEAIARDEIRDEEGALAAIERALDLGEPRGFLSPFVRHPLARPLLRRRIRAGTAHRAFVADILALMEEEQNRDALSSGSVLDPLSARELAVLRFLPTMMSNADIASEMFVSVNTVKTHLKHVYRKLDVADRREAVLRARELQLLSPGLADR